MTWQPVPSSADHCIDCGTAIDHHHGEERCPACFEKHLFSVDVGFLDNYRKFGARAHLIVAETCLRGLVMASPEHRKILAMTIFEQYVQSMNDLAGLHTALRNRDRAPIMKSFLEFRLDSKTAPSFYDSVQSLNDYELIADLGLPMPGDVAALCPHLDAKDAREVSIAVYHLVQDLRKATDAGSEAALALAQFAGQASGSMIASEASWLTETPREMTPDQVALLILDDKRRSIYVQGLTADEASMGQVIDMIDTATRAASNLIYAYLQTNNL